MFKGKNLFNILRLECVMCSCSELIQDKLTMDRDDNFNRNRILNLFAFFIESLSLYTQSFLRQYNHIIRRFLENFQIAELFDVISEKVSEHPPLKYIVCATALSCAVPVVMFIIFGISTMIVTFAGFLFVEGTLLAVGGLCLFICILSIILVLSFLGLTIAIFYMLASKLQNIFSKYETTSNILNNYSLVNIEPRNNCSTVAHQD